MLKSLLLTMALLCLFALLGGCAARPGPELFASLPTTPAATAAPKRPVTMTVATDRAPDPAQAGNFTKARAQVLSIGRYELSIPPGHKATNIEWTRAHAGDAAKCFSVVSYAPQPADYFRQAAGLDAGAPSPAALAVEPAAAKPAAATSAEPTAKGADVASAKATASHDAPPTKPADDGREDVVIFVHGYNTNYAESVLRMAQLLADNPFKGEAVLFAWPSDGELSGYVADKDAATFARDHLVKLLVEIAANPHYRQITLTAHSMGCWLTMEALRQLRLTGRDKVLARLGPVILAAPDIDLDVFSAQAGAVGRMEPPLTILASPDDRALEFSDRLGGDRARLGGLDVRDPRIQQLAQDYGIRIIDISGSAATDSLNHDRYIGATAALKAAMAARKPQNPLRKAGAFILDAVASVLETPGRIGRAAADTMQ